MGLLLKDGTVTLHFDDASGGTTPSDGPGDTPGGEETGPTSEQIQAAINGNTARFNSIGNAIVSKLKQASNNANVDVTVTVYKDRPYEISISGNTHNITKEDVINYINNAAGTGPLFDVNDPATSYTISVSHNHGHGTEMSVSSS